MKIKIGQKCRISSPVHKRGDEKSVRYGVIKKIIPKIILIKTKNYCTSLMFLDVKFGSEWRLEVWTGKAWVEVKAELENDFTEMIGE